MTARARVVLEDCRAQLAALDYGLPGPEWRRAWVATVALLRAVGHVLEKVDGKSSPGMARAVKAEFARLKRERGENKIFWDFIERERNNVLKEYREPAVHAT